MRLRPNQHIYYYILRSARYYFVAFGIDFFLTILKFLPKYCIFKLMILIIIYLLIPNKIYKCKCEYNVYQNKPSVCVWGGEEKETVCVGGEYLQLDKNCMKTCLSCPYLSLISFCLSHKEPVIGLRSSTLYFVLGFMSQSCCVMLGKIIKRCFCYLLFAICILKISFLQF